MILMTEQLKAEIVNQWGEVSQINQAIEELNELCVALSHARRNSPRTADVRLDVIEELTDVILMIEEIKYIFLIDDHEIEVISREKLRRVNNLLAESKGENQC